MVVYVVQETGHNVLQAANFGSLKVVYPQGYNILLDPESAVQRARQRMFSFGPDDFILLVGDPVAIGLCTAIAAEATGGKYKVLKWDRRTGQYWPIEINLNLKGGVEN